MTEIHNNCTVFCVERVFRAILLQVVATPLAAAVFAVMAGARAAESALLGGAACVVPNFMFALRLYALSKKPGASYAANFFLGEFVKVAATIALLVLIVKTYADLHWPAMLIGLGLALQAGFLAFFKKS